VKQIIKTVIGMGLALALQAYAASQAITGLSGGPTVYAATGIVTVVATGGGSLAPVTFTSITEDVCTVGGTNGEEVTTVGVGPCIIQADQAAEGSYDAAPSVFDTTAVGKAPQVVTVNPTIVSGSLTYGTSFVITTSAAGASGNPVVYSTVSSSVCIISNIAGTITVYPIDAGACNVTADQAGNSKYLAGTDTEVFTITKASQTISAFSHAAMTYGVAATVSTTGGGSGVAIVYSSTTSDGSGSGTAVCTVNSSTGLITPVDAGTCYITANQGGDTRYNAASAVTSSAITINKAVATIATITGGPSVYGTPASVVTSTNSNGTILYTSTTSDGTGDGTSVCTVDAAGVVTPVIAGNCYITANVAATTKFLAATEVTSSAIVIAKLSQAITGWTAGTPTFGTDFSVSATKGAGSAALVYASTTTGVCTVVDAAAGTFHPVTGGVCTITVAQAADTKYAAATTISNNVSISPKAQTIGSITGGPSIYPTAAAVAAVASSGLTVSFISMTPSVCTSSGVNGATITPVAGGDCKIAANQAGSVSYIAATQKERTIVIDLANQTITAAPSLLAGTQTFGSTFTVQATASSGIATTFTSSTTGVCTVSGITVTPVTAGNCMITANQIGDLRYNAAPPISTTFTIAKATQTINTLVGGPTIVGNTAAVTATATIGSGNSAVVVLGSLTPSVCTLAGTTSGSIATAVSAGTCTISADLAGNTSYNAATQVLLNITIAQKSQTIGAVTAGSTPTYGTNFTVSAASSGLSGNPVIFTIPVTTGVCTILGNTVTPVTAGTCTVVANQAGNTNYTAATTVTTSFAIAKKTQTIGTLTGGPTAYKPAGAGAADVTAAATSGNAVVFTTTTPSVCTVSGITVTPVSGGTCTIKANSAADTKYEAAPEKSQDFVINTASQSIAAITGGTGAVYGTAFDVAATATSGLAVTFSIPSTTTICSRSGNTITPKKAGTCTVLATQAGDASYSSTTLSRDIIISKADQEITLFTATPSAVNFGTTSTVAAYGGAGGEPVVFGTNTPSICTVSGTNNHTVTPVLAGTCVITANQAADAGDTLYNAAPQVLLNIVVSKANQAITWNPVPTPASPTYGSTFTVSAGTGGSSGQPVVISSVTDNTFCTVVGSTVTALKVGTCTLTANQALDTRYNAAPTVTQTFTIAKASQTVATITGGPSVYGSPANVVTTASSGGAIVYSSLTADSCSVNSSTGLVTPLGHGACIIKAKVAASTNYLADSNQVTLTIAKANQTLGAISGGPTTVGATATVSATATSGIPVTFTTNNSGICSFSGNDLTVHTGAACIITAHQAGDARYNAASNLVTKTITATKAAQTITLDGSVPNSAPYGADFTMIATGGGSNIEVVFTSNTPLICSVSGTYGQLVHPIMAGSCIIAANQAGDGANYEAATQLLKTITITKAPQTLVVSAVTNPVVPTYGTPFSVSATGGASDKSIQFTSSTTGVCTVGATSVSGSIYSATVTPVTDGTCTLLADRVGDASYANADQESKDFTIAKQAQTINAMPTPSIVYGVLTGTVATTAESGLAVSYAMTSDAGVCTVNASTGVITPVAEGTCTITASQAGGSGVGTKWLPADDITTTVTITLATQTVGTIAKSTATPTWGTDLTVSATATPVSDPVNAVTFTSLDPTYCTVTSGGLVSPVLPTIASSGVGSCQIRATAVATTQYSSATNNLNFAIVKGEQDAITVTGATLGVLPDVVFGADFTMAATGGGSSEPVVFSSNSTLICSVGGTNGAVVTPLKSGACIIAADQDGDATYNAATQVLTTITITKAPQTIAVSSVTNPVVPTYGTPFTVSASGGESANDIVFTSGTTGVCTVGATTETGTTNVYTASVTPVTDGTCTLLANRLGDVSYANAGQVSTDFTIAKQAQTINAMATPSIAYGVLTGTVATTATSGLAVSYAMTSAAGVCTVNASTGVITPVAEGTCTITASQAGGSGVGSKWLPAVSITTTVTITKSAQTVGTITKSTATPTWGTTLTVSATATPVSSPVNAVTFTSLDEAYCTVTSGGVVTPVKATTASTGSGSCQIRGDAAATTQYSAASNTLNFAIAKKAQTITNLASGPATFGVSVNLSTTAASGLTVTYAIKSTSSSICEMSGSTIVKPLKAGTCTVLMNQAGDTKWAAAPEVSQDFRINQAPQTIEAISGISASNYPSTFVLSTLTTSLLPLTFVSTDLAVCTVGASTQDGTTKVSSATVTPLKSGSCVVEARQLGDADSTFAAATATSKTITISNGAQTIAAITGGPGVVGATFNVSTTGGASGSPIVFSSLSPLFCSVTAGGVVTPVKATTATTGAGSCQIAANQAGLANKYDAATQVTKDIVIAKATQTVAITLASSLAFTSSFTVTAVATSGLAVVLSDSTPTICSVGPTTQVGSSTTYIATVTPLTTGSCFVKATQNGGDGTMYSAAPVVGEDVTISQATQTIVWSSTTSPATPTYGTNFTVTAAPSSGLTPVLTSNTPTFCTVSGNTVTPVKVGTCSINAVQAGNGNYQAASGVDKSFEIALASQTITVVLPALTYGEEKDVDATTTATGLTVSLTSLTPYACTVTGLKVKAVDDGPCQLLATQAGDVTKYSPASQVLSNTVTIGMGVQTITWAAAPANLTYKNTFTILATGGASGQPVTYAAVSGCTISGTTVTPTLVGTDACIITASQAGNVRYNAAPDSSKKFTIGKATQTIAAITNGPLAIGDSNLVATTSTSLLTGFAFSTLTPSVCTSTGTAGAGIKALTMGYCIVKVIEPGNASYLPDTNSTTFIVGRDSQVVASIANIPDTYRDTATVSTTSSSNLTAFTYTSETPLVCTVLGAKVTAINVGKCKIKAVQAGSSFFFPVTKLDSATVLPATQVVKFTGALTAKYLDVVTMSATSTSGLTDFTYSTASAAICSVGTVGNAGKLYPIKKGSCVVQARQAGNALWNADSTGTDSTVVISERTQTIAAMTGGPSIYGDSATVSTTSTSGLTMTYSIAPTTATICSVGTTAGRLNKVFAIKAGTCTIKARAPASTDYWLSDSLSQNFIIAKKDQSLTAIAGGPTRYGDTVEVLSVASSGLTVVYTTLTPTICSVVSLTKVYGLLPGTCKIKASQAGDNLNWNAADPDTMTVVLAKRTLKVVPLEFSKEFGGTDSLKYAIDNSQAFGDTIRSGDKLVGTLSREVGENVGTYHILRGTLTALANPKYEIDFDSTVHLTITQKVITVTADSLTKVYGAANPTTYTYKVLPALKTGQTLTGALTRDAGETVGTYGILRGGLTDAANLNYSITFVSKNFKITRMPLTVTAVADTQVYNGTEPALTWTTTPATLTGVAPATLAAVNGALTRKAGDAAGTYPILQGTVDTIQNPNYKITFVTKNFLITPKPITVTATAKTILYGAPDSLKYTVSGAPDSLKTGDVLAGALIRKAGTTIGVYPIAVGTIKNANYKITFVPANLTIATLPITVTAADTTKVYGGLDPKFRLVISRGLLTGQAALVGKDVLLGTAVRDTGKTVKVAPASYAITAGTVATLNKNYAVTFVPGKMYITRKPITVTADTLTKVYGDPTHRVLTFKTVGLVTGDAVVGGLVRERSATDSSIGVYGISQNATMLDADSNPNYTITFVHKHLRITPRPLSVKADVKTYVYGNDSIPNVNYLTYGTPLFAYSDTFPDSQKLTRVSGNTVGKYLISQGALADSNYKISFTTNYLNVTAKPLAVTATAGTKVYGATDDLHYTISAAADSSLETGDTLAGAMTRKLGTVVGKYPILVGTLKNANYAIKFKSDTLEITRKPITIIAHDTTKVYGYADPVFKYSVTSGGVEAGALVGGTALKGTLSREAGSAVGTYKITQGTVNDSLNPNYTVTFNADTLLTINKRPVTVTPVAKSKVYDKVTTTPVLTYTASGLLSGEPLTGALARAEGENVGTYAISGGTIVADGANTNYAITVATGKLVTITKKPITIKMAAATKVVGADDPDLSALATVATLVEGDALSGFTGAISRTTGSVVGKYAMTSTLASPNYTVAFTTNYLTITAAPIAKYAMEPGEGVLAPKAISMATIQGATSVYDIDGTLVWNGDIQLGDIGHLQNTLSAGRYIVKNINTGSFIWSKN
jgi:hypothetical protein